MGIGTEKRHVEKPHGKCAKTGRDIGEGEDYYAVLFEDGEGFRREDYSVDAWDGPPDGAYCHFKTRMPIKEAKKRLLVDDAVLISFFERLASETEPARVRFRFVLALILMRKRLLKYDHTEHKEGRELWLMRLVKETRQHRVENPRLTDDEIEEVSQQVGAILAGDTGSLSDDESDDEAPPDS